MFRTEENLEFARRVVEAIGFPSDFASDEDERISTIYSEKVAEVVDEDFYVTNGISKLVIDIESLPFVIKIPFDGRMASEEVEEDEWEDYYIPFECGDGKYNNDYCLTEMRMTDLIKDSEYDMFCLDMEYLCTVDGRDVYIQEKAKIFEDCRKSIHPTADSFNKAKKRNNDYLLDPSWRALAYDMYGEEKFENFMAWAQDNAPELMSDMHAANYGIALDGRPVLIDISGFND